MCVHARARVSRSTLLRFATQTVIAVCSSGIARHAAAVNDQRPALRRTLTSFLPA